MDDLKLGHGRGVSSMLEIAEGMIRQNAKLDSLRVEMSKPALPDANPKTRYGMAKPGLSNVPNTALLYLGRVHDNGAEKYGPFNWRKDPVTESVYYNAIHRHLMLYHDGHLLDDGEGGSGLPHLAHVMACCAILIDAREQGTLNDDRPTPGKVAEVMALLTRPLEK